HMMRLFGWLKMSAAYDLLVKALHNKAPQFQKSRVAAAIALSQLASPTAVPELKSALAVPIWDLQYAAIMALSQLGQNPPELASIVNTASLQTSPDWLVKEKLNTL
ncbi:MAG: HEAT repeat domain-containing protein, partial [Phormidesmis sp.]